MLSKAWFGSHWVWLLLIVTVLCFSFATTDNLPAWAAFVPLSANQTVPPFDLNLYLPRLIDPPATNNITNSPAKDFSPQWSPDGDKIAFASNRDGDWDLYVMDTHGANVVQITNDLVTPNDPSIPFRIEFLSHSWSPNSEALALLVTWWVGAIRGGHLESKRYVVNADDSNLMVLTPTTEGFYCYPSAPQWSPVGTKLLYSDPDCSIHSINADGTNPITLLDPIGGINGSGPTWSPDGGKIAFIGYTGGMSDIYVMNANGSNSTNLTSNNPQLEDILKFVWSPDGSKIAFWHQVSETLYHELMVMKANGRDLVLLGNIQWDEGYGLAWSPNDDRIAFYGHSLDPLVRGIGLYMINSDGNDLTLLRSCNEIPPSSSPAWSPDGTKIAFACDDDREIFVIELPLR